MHKVADPAAGLTTSYPAPASGLRRGFAPERLLPQLRALPADAPIVVDGAQSRAWQATQRGAHHDARRRAPLHLVIDFILRVRPRTRQMRGCAIACWRQCIRCHAVQLTTVQLPSQLWHGRLLIARLNAAAT